MKIFCVGRNYIDHAKELNNPIPESPVIFIKPRTSLLEKNEPFYHPSFSNDIHYEIELVLKIKKNGKHIQAPFVPDYLEEITVGVDLTARDLQSKLKSKGHPWELAKAFDHSAIVGDFVSLDSLPSKKNIEFSLSQNRKEVQHGNSKDMLFTFHEIVVYISQFFTLNIGDLIFTGTPAGVGRVKSGDTLEGFLERQSRFTCQIC